MACQKLPRAANEQKKCSKLDVSLHDTLMDVKAIMWLVLRKKVSVHFTQNFPVSLEPFIFDAIARRLSWSSFIDTLFVSIGFGVRAKITNFSVYSSHKFINFFLSISTVIIYQVVLWVIVPSWSKLIKMKNVSTSKSIIN